MDKHFPYVVVSRGHVEPQPSLDSAMLEARRGDGLVVEFSEAYRMFEELQEQFTAFGTVREYADGYLRA